MRKGAVLATLALNMGCAIIALGGESPPGESCVGTLYLRLQRGDSLSGLFGTEWEKVWRCNQAVFIRSGREVLSPDLVAAGQVIRIPADTELTAMAQARLEELRAHREQAQRKLDALAAKSGEEAGAKNAVDECRRVLGDSRRFASDLTYVDRQLEYLEGFARGKPASDRVAPDLRTTVGGALAALLMMLLAAAVWRLGHLHHDSNLAVREVRAAKRLAELCREAGIRFEP